MTVFPPHSPSKPQLTFLVSLRQPKQDIYKLPHVDFHIVILPLPPFFLFFFFSFPSIFLHYISPWLELALSTRSPARVRLSKLPPALIKLMWYRVHARTAPEPVGTHS